MSRPGHARPSWKAWLLLAVGLWAFLVPGWAVPQGYRYDDLNRLEYVDDGMTGVLRTSEYAYTANGSLERVRYANGVEHLYGYDSLNRLRGLSVSQIASEGGVPGRLHHAYQYRLRASGHREQVVEAGRTTTYTYDELYRLVGEQVTGASGAQGADRTIRYDLDKVGNRLNRYSDLAAVIPQLGRTYNARDWLTSDSYDLNGNTVVGTNALGERSVLDVYDFEDRLIVRTRMDGSQINLLYDADGMRIQKTLLGATGQIAATTTYLVDTNNLTGYAQVLEEATTAASATTTRRHYTYGADLLRSVAVDEAGTLGADRYFLYDGGGSVRELADQAGNITDTFDYDAFGVLVKRTGTTENAYLYRGEQWDQDLGLYYNRARYLNQDAGRFWSMDEYEGDADPFSLHKYLYATGDPVGGLDPSGNFTLPELGMVGKVIGSLAALAIPSIKTWMIGWVKDSLSDDSRYSLSSLGVYDTEDSLLLQEDIGLDVNDFSANVFADAAAHMFGEVVTGGFTPAGLAAGAPGAQQVMGMMQAGRGTAMGVSAFRKAKPLQTGSYTVFFGNGNRYHGKGPKSRAESSGRRLSRKHNTPHVATDWKPSNTRRDAYKDEARRIRGDKGISNPTNYNQVNSPGENYLRQDGEP